MKLLRLKIERVRNNISDIDEKEVGEVGVPGDAGGGRGRLGLW